MQGLNFKKTKKENFLDNALSNKKQGIQKPKSENFTISFEDFDDTQKSGSGFKDWQSVGLLSTMLEVLRGYCCSPLIPQLDGQKFVIYGDFPAPEKTKFTRPKHVSPDAEWGRIHINNTTVIAGHVINNTFYVVFLDKHHHFYISKKKHT
jgi:hypothetical protein